MRIKRIGGSNSGEDFNGGLSYIIGSWLIEEGQEPIVIILYIITFYLTSSNIYI